MDTEISTLIAGEHDNVIAMTREINSRQGDIADKKASERIILARCAELLYACCCSLRVPCARSEAGMGNP
jgi:hypothetical protein